MSGQRRNQTKRRDWAIAKTTLKAEIESRQSALPPRDSLAMMWQLALDAWASAGRPIPEYSRDQARVSKLTIHVAPPSKD